MVGCMEVHLWSAARGTAGRIRVIIFEGRQAARQENGCGGYGALATTITTLCSGSIHR